MVEVLAQKRYEVQIENGLLRNVGEKLVSLLPNCSTVAVIADDTVDALYGGMVERTLTESRFSVCGYTFPHGEKQKNLGTWQAMVCFLAEQGLTGTDAVLALGGGVTGDMAGFAAASYLRGIRLVQVPTTLLAMVDSSVGGKTGVNLPMGKNLTGAFYQPAVVLCDPETLSTLPREALLDGVAEAIKMGVLQDEPLLDLLSSADFAGHIEEVIFRCVAAKAKLVEEDERDKGSRRLLNLGHTLGHAIEWCSRYQTSHGYAVAVGMVYAARLSVRLGLCPSGVLQRISDVLQRNGLPISAPYSAQELLQAVLRDKKREGEQLTFVLPTAIGRCALHPVPVAELPAAIAMATEE